MSSAPPLTCLLEFEQRLHVDCGRCTRRLVFTPQEAISAFGAEMTIPRLARTLKCSACGARGRNREISVYPNTNDYYAWHDRQRYERMVREQGQTEADHWAAHRHSNLLRQ